MKLPICGKGGCGKSTVSALIAAGLKKLGYQVLVVDADESNFGLHRPGGNTSGHIHHFPGRSAFLLSASQIQKRMGNLTMAFSFA